MSGSPVYVCPTGPTSCEVRTKKNHEVIATFASQAWAEWFKDQVDASTSQGDYVDLSPKLELRVAA